MFEFIIDVSEIEELQMIQNKEALDIIFSRAERTVIGGGIVSLVRKTPKTAPAKFDEFSTEADLAQYKKTVYKYLD